MSKVTEQQKLYASAKLAINGCTVHCRNTVHAINIAKHMGLILCDRMLQEHVQITCFDMWLHLQPLLSKNMGDKHITHVCFMFYGNMPCIVLVCNVQNEKQETLCYVLNLTCQNKSMWDYIKLDETRFTR